MMLLCLILYLCFFSHPRTGESFYLHRGVPVRNIYSHSHFGDESIIKSLVENYSLSTRTKRKSEITQYYSSNSLSVLKLLRNYMLPTKAIGKLIQKYPAILALSSSHIEQISSLFKNRLNLSKKEVKSLLLKRPSLFQKSEEEIDATLDLFRTTLQLDKSSLKLLLLVKSSLFDLDLQTLHCYSSVLLSQYHLKVADIQKILQDKSCNVFSPHLLRNIDLRIKLIQSSFGFLSFHENRKWQQLVRNCPKLLITSPEYFSQYLEILRQEFQFEAKETETFQAFLLSSSKIFYFQSLSLVRLRALILMGFFTNCYSDLRSENNDNALTNEERALLKEDNRKATKKLSQELAFYKGYLDYLEGKGSLDDSQQASQCYIGYIKSLLQKYCIDFGCSAFQEENKRTYFEDVKFSFWTEIEFMELSRQESIRVLSRGNAMSFSFSHIVETLGLLSASLALTTDELAHILKIQPR